MSIRKMADYSDINKFNTNVEKITDGTLWKSRRERHFGESLKHRTRCFRIIRGRK